MSDQEGAERPVSYLYCRHWAWTACPRKHRQGAALWRNRVGRPPVGIGLWEVGGQGGWSWLKNLEEEEKICRCLGISGCQVSGSSTASLCVKWFRRASDFQPAPQRPQGRGPVPDPPRSPEGDRLDPLHLNLPLEDLLDGPLVRPLLHLLPADQVEPFGGEDHVPLDRLRGEQQRRAWFPGRKWRPQLERAPTGWRFSRGATHTCSKQQSNPGPAAAATQGRLWEGRPSLLQNILEST